MLVSLTVGKVDAGVAVLLTEDKRLVSREGVPEAISRLSSQPIISKPRLADSLCLPARSNSPRYSSRPT